MNPDGSGAQYTPEKIQELVGSFPPPNFIGKAVPAIISTRSGKFLWIDNGIEELSGYTAGHFVSGTMQDILPSLHTPEHGMIIGEMFIEVVQYLQQELQGRMDIQISMDHNILMKQGDKKRVLSHLWPLEWDKAGNLILLGLYYVDISHLGKGGAPSVAVLSGGQLLREFHPAISNMANMHLLNLTERELELLVMESHGLSIDEISEKTHLAKATIYTHRRNILQRSGHSSTTKLIEELREKGVV
jgi:DNA-binding CsgD family transcriptional regulator